MEKIKISKAAILQTVEFLNNGGVVIFPTDTVYGFLALADNKKAINKIYKIKNRPKTKPLPVFVKDFKMAKELAEISEKQLKILKKKWPGKYTFVLHCSFRHPGDLSADEAGSGNPVNKLWIPGQARNDTVALRVPKYKPLNDLLKKINKPLAQTSVNISGQETLIKSSEIEAQFKKQKILFVDAGNLKKSKPSKIINLIGDKLTRLRQ
jgi:L-threonylcarbamoyladenylate synthase